MASSPTISAADGTARFNANITATDSTDGIVTVDADLKVTGQLILDSDIVVTGAGVYDRILVTNGGDSDFPLDDAPDYDKTTLRVGTSPLAGAITAVFADPAGNETVRIAGDGNVRVFNQLYISPDSSVNPSSSFSVYMDGNTYDNPIFQKAQDNSGGIAIAQKRARGTLASPTKLQKDDVVGGFTGFGHDSNQYQFAAAVRYRVDSDVSAGVVPIRISLETTETINPVERLVVKPNGNIGIGTTDPTAPLSILKSNSNTTIGGSESVIKVRNPSGIIGSTSGLEFFHGNVETNVQRLAGIYGQYKKFDPNGFGGALVFATSSSGDSSITEAMRIDSDGSVDIGGEENNNPFLFAPATLDVKNSIRIWAEQGGASLRIQDGNDQTSRITQLASTNALGFFRNEVEVMRIDSGGNIGLNVVPEVWEANTSTVISLGETSSIWDYTNGINRQTNIVNNLYWDSGFKSIVADGWGWMRIVGGGTGVPDISFASGVSAVAGETITSPDDDVKMIIKGSTGNVGIGTDSPESKLHLADTGPVVLTLEADTDNFDETDNARIVMYQDNRAVSARIGYRNNTNNLEIFNEYSLGDLILGTHDSDAMIIKSDGSVFFGDGAFFGNLSAQRFNFSDGTTAVGGTAIATFQRRSKVGWDGSRSSMVIGTTDVASARSIEFDTNAEGAVTFGADGTLTVLAPSTQTVVIGGTGTIGGSTWTNGSFHLGDSVSGWAMDRNELYNGGAAIIGTINDTLTLNPKTSTISSKQVQFTATNNNLGTITTGVWNGSVIASAYLDADTVHLSGTQTFTGTKNFNTNTNTVPLNISRIGSNSSQTLQIGVTDAEAIFNYIEDTTSEGTGNYGSYIFQVSGNEGTSPTVQVLRLDEGVATFAGAVTGSNLSGTNTGDEPDASASVAGIVTTGTQTFSGTKTFGTANFSQVNINAADALSFENGKHWITYNDAQGNFNFRFAHYSNTSTQEEVTEDGYISHWEYSQSTGLWNFQVSNASMSLNEPGGPPDYIGDGTHLWLSQLQITPTYTSLGYGGSTKIATTNTGVTVTGTVSATTFSGAFSGNSTTTTTLETARNINGTSFDGSADITTAQWGTARTLTIGDTGKSVNGSTAYSWTRTELGITKTNIDALDIAAASLNNDGGQAIARGMGWEGTYGAGSTTQAENSVSWDFTEKCLVIRGDQGDTSIGAAYRAIRVQPGEKINFTITAKADASYASGFYLRLYYYNGDLPDGKTHVSNSSSLGSPFVQEDTAGLTNWRENQAISTTWETYSYDYTHNETSAGYVSLVCLNWTGIGSGDVYLRQPDVTRVSGGRLVLDADTNGGSTANTKNGFNDNVSNKKIVFGNYVTNNDHIQLYGQGSTTGGYGIGIESSTLYFRSGSLFRWYSGTVANTGTSDVMELNSSGTLSTTTFNSTSDIRHKKNVKTIENALDKVNAIRGVTYEMNEKKGIGVIAQELLEVIPEVVDTSDEDKYTVSYGNIVGLLVQAVKEQQSEIQELKEVINKHIT